MKVVSVLRRLAGKSPAYIVRRGWREIGRVVNGGRLNRRLRSIAIDDVLRSTAHSSSTELIQSLRERSFIISEADRAAVQSLYATRFAAEKRNLDRYVDDILDHNFDLLGSGPTPLGKAIDWQSDFKTGFRWALTRSTLLDYAQLDKPCDVKVPWELSRFQHLTALGRKWVIDRDARCVAEFQSEVSSWISANPPGIGVNWACTMDVALRAVSWIWSLMLFADAPLERHFVDAIVVSLAQHALWIPANLELSDINGNHFISDALGLVACGAFFRDSAEGRRWLAQGIDFLEREIQLQVERDGVNIEASVQYHRLVLEIFLTGAILMRHAGSPESAEYREKLSAMIDYVYAYVTPDGLSPVVGDADDGRALILGGSAIRDHRYLLSTGAVMFERGDWKARSTQLREETVWFLGAGAASAYDNVKAVERDDSKAFADSGVFIFRSPQQYLFVDAGPVGFRGRGGHGHNDCLSFDWYVDAAPVISDSGAFVYTASPEWRNRFRSTAFHNTIRVDEQEINRFPDSLSLWSLRDDAQPVNVSFSVAGQQFLDATHTGYERLDGRVRVGRRFDFSSNEARIAIHDSIGGTGMHKLEFFFHVAANISVAIERQSIKMSVGPRTMRLACDRDDLRLETKQGWFSPTYGVKIERTTIVATVQAALPFSVNWVLEGNCYKSQ